MLLFFFFPFSQRMNVSSNRLETSKVWKIPMNRNQIWRRLETLQSKQGTGEEES